MKMKLKFNEIMHAACCAGVAINTVLFAVNLFANMHYFAFFNIISALGCWVGIFSFGRKINGNEQ
jgi:hypothetical protein